MSTRAVLGYRLLLLLLPPRFRREFGPELEAVLVERLRDARGAAARAWIWLIAVVDVLTSMPAEWAPALRHRRTVSLDFKLGFRMLVQYPGLTIVGGLAMAFAIALLALDAAFMLGVCLLACLVPTRRALGVEPAEALRAEQARRRTERFPRSVHRPHTDGSPSRHRQSR